MTYRMSYDLVMYMLMLMICSGLKAAKAAGMNCCVTQSVYSRGEDFSSADVIVDDLDHGTDGPITMTYLNCKFIKLFILFI